MWNIEKTVDQDHLGWAFDCYQSTTGLLKSLTTFFNKDEKDIFIVDLLGGHNYVGMENGNINCLIHSEIKEGNICEGHLFCNKKANIELIIATINFARVDLLKNYRLIICQVMEKHKTLNEIIQRSNFHDSGLRCWQSVYKNSLVEVKYYVAGAIK